MGNGNRENLIEVSSYQLKLHFERALVLMMYFICPVFRIIFYLFLMTELEYVDVVFLEKGFLSMGKIKKVKNLYG